LSTVSAVCWKYITIAYDCMIAVMLTMEEFLGNFKENRLSKCIKIYGWTHVGVIVVAVVAGVICLFLYGGHIGLHTGMETAHEILFWVYETTSDTVYLWKILKYILNKQGVSVRIQCNLTQG
jgi:hypothetical protein